MNALSVAGIQQQTKMAGTLAQQVGVVKHWTVVKLQSQPKVKGLQ
jgi:hypothetical protein